MTAVEQLEKKLVQIRLHVDKNVLKFIDSSINEAKEIEKQQIIYARVNGVCEGIDLGASVIKEDISKSHEIYYNETFNK